MDLIQMEAALIDLLQEVRDQVAYQSRNVIHVGDAHDAKLTVYTRIESRLSRMLEEDPGMPGRCSVCNRYVYNVRSHMAEAHKQEFSKPEAPVAN